MVQNQFLEIRAGALVHEALFVKKEVVAYAASNVGVTYALDCGNAGIEPEKTLVGTVQILAGRRKEAGFAATALTD